jgi:hypothetical protein
VFSSGTENESFSENTFPNLVRWLGIDVQLTVELVSLFSFSFSSFVVSSLLLFCLVKFFRPF